jgi:hypothetical protein
MQRHIPVVPATKQQSILEGYVCFLGRCVMRFQQQNYLQHSQHMQQKQQKQQKQPHQQQAVQVPQYL